MPKKEHRVRDGECIASIAFQYGFFPDTVWEDPDNSQLKDARKNPGMLAAGDVVTIPEKRMQKISAAAEQRHSFRRKGVPEKLSLVLRMNGKPRALLDYRIVFDGKETAGTTDKDGLLEHFIPPNTQSGKLIIDPDEEHDLKLGTLPQLETREGLIVRLRNMAYLPPDADDDDSLAAAITAFQTRNGLTPSGEADKETTEKIREQYSC